jgi:hypothetical protein
LFPSPQLFPWIHPSPFESIKILKHNITERIGVSENQDSRISLHCHCLSLIAGKLKIGRYLTWRGDLTMDELLDIGEMLDNPILLLLVALGGGGGLMALMLVGSYFTTGDVSDLVWGIILLLLQG